MQDAGCRMLEGKNHDFTAKTHRRDAESAEFYISIISAYSASRR
jgi:hypothetical protein